ncbi:hypothetical protein PR048_033378 [Dryococelus australis]|uniref:Uncharacterized protein n=1 Tax=Dryococelus australis TaxID=614101 RepID=A0ABQ9G041_9NEOP|nr:hypothetical protein PR048_033378 [Dryococelus australis]
MGLYVVTQELDEQTMYQPGPKNEIKLSQMRVIFGGRNKAKEYELINIKIQHYRQFPKYVNTKLREIFKDVFTPKQMERLI